MVQVTKVPHLVATDHTQLLWRTSPLLRPHPLTCCCRSTCHQQPTLMLLALVLVLVLAQAVLMLVALVPALVLLLVSMSLSLVLVTGVTLLAGRAQVQDPAVPASSVSMRSGDSGEPTGNAR